jgi:hypothetical protein
MCGRFTDTGCSFFQVVSGFGRPERPALPHQQQFSGRRQLPVCRGKDATKWRNCQICRRFDKMADGKPPCF